MTNTDQLDAAIKAFNRETKRFYLLEFKRLISDRLRLHEPMEHGAVIAELKVILRILELQLDEK